MLCNSKVFCQPSANMQKAAGVFVSASLSRTHELALRRGRCCALCWPPPPVASAGSVNHTPAATNAHKDVHAAPSKQASLLRGAHLLPHSPTPGTTRHSASSEWSISDVTTFMAGKAVHTWRQGGGDGAQVFEFAVIIGWMTACPTGCSVTLVAPQATTAAPKAAAILQAEPQRPCPVPKRCSRSRVCGVDAPSPNPTASRTCCAFSRRTRPPGTCAQQVRPAPAPAAPPTRAGARVLTLCTASGAAMTQRKRIASSLTPRSSRTWGWLVGWLVVWLGQLLGQLGSELGSELVGWAGERLFRRLVDWVVGCAAGWVVLGGLRGGGGECVWRGRERGGVLGVWLVTGTGAPGAE
jgi:hypothetical protein